MIKGGEGGSEGGFGGRLWLGHPSSLLMPKHRRPPTTAPQGTHVPNLQPQNRWIPLTGMCTWAPEVPDFFLFQFLQEECLPGARPAHARRATFVLSILSLAPSPSSPCGIPQVDRTGPQTFPARHVA